MSGEPRTSLPPGRNSGGTSRLTATPNNGATGPEERAAQPGPALRTTSTQLLSALVAITTGCDEARYFDRPAAEGAATMVYFVHDERAVERAIVVEAQEGYYPSQLQLAAEHPRDTVVTVVAYKHRPKELGLRPGRLAETAEGKPLPSPDLLLQTRAVDDGWRPLSEMPAPVASFRTTAVHSPRCHELVPQPLSIPFQTSGTIDFDGIEAVTLTATSAFLHAHARILAEVSTPLTYQYLQPFEDSRSTCIFSPARSGTTAVGACGWLFRFHVEGSRLVRTPWGDRYGFVLADEAGELAATGFDDVERMTLAAEPLGHLDANVHWPAEATFRKIAYFNQEIFVLFEEALHRVTATGTVAEVVSEPHVTALGVANRAIYAGGQRGAVLRRSAAGNWEPIPSGANASAVQAILPISGGIFVIWADGRGAEYFDDLGWCPEAEVTRGTLDVAVRLGAGYLLGTARQSSLALNWIDLGLRP